MSLPSSQGAVVVDANILIAICTQEQNKQSKAEAALQDYAARGFLFYAPSVIVSESLYVICNKAQNGLISSSDHDNAIQNLIDQMKAILLAPKGRSSDSLYLALAEDLSRGGHTELLTFDRDLINQAAKNTPTVKVNLLPV